MKSQITILFLFVFFFLTNSQIKANYIYIDKNPVNIVNDTIPMVSVSTDTIISYKRHKKSFPCQLAYPFKIMESSKKIFDLAKFPDTDKPLLFLLWLIGWLIIFIPVYIIGAMVFVLGLVVLLFYLSIFVSIFLGISFGLLLFFGIPFSFGIILAVTVLSVLIGAFLYFLLASFC